jgi:hypothetical protein
MEWHLWALWGKGKRPLPEPLQSILDKYSIKPEWDIILHDCQEPRRFFVPDPKLGATLILLSGYAEEWPILIQACHRARKRWWSDSPPPENSPFLFIGTDGLIFEDGVEIAPGSWDDLEEQILHLIPNISARIASSS